MGKLTDELIKKMKDRMKGGTPFMQTRNYAPKKPKEITKTFEIRTPKRPIEKPTQYNRNQKYYEAMKRVYEDKDTKFGVGVGP